MLVIAVSSPGPQQSDTDARIPLASESGLLGTSTRAWVIPFNSRDMGLLCSLRQVRLGLHFLADAMGQECETLVDVTLFDRELHRIPGGNEHGVGVFAHGRGTGG